VLAGYTEANKNCLARAYKYARVKSQTE